MHHGRRRAAVLAKQEERSPVITGDLCDPFMGGVGFRLQTQIEFGCLVYVQVGNYPLNFKVLLIDHTMQIEASFTAHNVADYAASDLGFLLHKHSDHMRSRETSAGEIAVFYSERSQGRITAATYRHVSRRPAGWDKPDPRWSAGRIRA